MGFYYDCGPVVYKPGFLVNMESADVLPAMHDVMWLASIMHKPLKLSLPYRMDDKYLCGVAVA